MCRIAETTDSGGQIWEHCHRALTGSQENPGADNPGQLTSLPAKAMRWVEVGCAMLSDPFSELSSLPPEIEDQRVRSLHQLHLLDTAPEERFARITRIAQLAFEVPVASINLVDHDRQWCKQVSGKDVEIDVPKEQSIHQATIAHSYRQGDDQELIIEDARADAELAQLPAVAGGAGVRFYAGYPLRGPGGHPVGTFSIIDMRPRRLDDNQREMFRELAAWAQRELVQSDDMDRAAEVQRQLLPPEMIDLPGYTVSAICIPAYAVGGDFYDCYPVPGGAAFTVADAMGKGLGAALMAANVRSALRGASRVPDRFSRDADLAAVVNSAAEQLADDLSRTDSFVTLFHAQLDTTAGSITYVDAGHGITRVVRSSGAVEPLDHRGLPIGIVPGDTWTSGHITLEPGDMLAVASDGTLDLLSQDTVEATAIIPEVLAAHRDPEALSEIFRALAADRPPVDDVTAMAIRRDN